MNEVQEKIDLHNAQTVSSRLECLRIRFELVSALGYIVSRPKESRDLFGDKFFEQIVEVFQSTYIDD